MKIWMLIPLVAGMVACNSTDGSNSDTDAADSTATASEEATAEMTDLLAEGEMMYFMKEGTDSVDFEGAMTAAEMLAMLEENNLDSAEVKVMGTVSAVCQKKGCWVNMPLVEGMKDLHVSYNYEFLLPPGGIEGDDVVIEGQVKKVTYSVDHLRHLAEDAGKTQEEIEAITEPETKLSFLATGVTVRG